MDWSTITTVAAGALTIAATIIGTAIKLTWWLGERLDKITTATADALGKHEEKDQSRHAEILQRITKVETIVEQLH